MKLEFELKQKLEKVNEQIKMKVVEQRLEEIAVRES